MNSIGFMTMMVSGGQSFKIVRSLMRDCSAQSIGMKIIEPLSPLIEGFAQNLWFWSTILQNFFINLGSLGF
jgi:hypothetical protein